MTNATKTSRSRGHWLVGVPALAVAIGMTVAYFRWPHLTNDWSIPAIIGFRTFVVFIGTVGLAQIAAALSSTRGALATPRFGSHRMIVPAEGIVYLAIMFVLFTGAMLTKQNTLLLVFAMMVGPFVVNGSLAFGMLRATRIVRSAPRRAMAGELFGVELNLSNRHPLLSMWMMSVRDEIAHDRETLFAEVLFARVGPRAAQTGHYQLRLAHRGRYRLGPLLVSSRFPLGLVERSRLFAMSSDVLVYPRIGRLTPLWKRRSQGATELIARPQARAGVFHDEFHRLREFRTGDNPRDIHWRTSARRGELILREYQQNRDLNLAVVLDLWQPSATAASPESIDLIERTLSFALTLLIEHSRECRDGTLSLAASGATPFQWEGQASAASLESLFDGLALLDAGSARETSLFLYETLHRTTASTQIVLLTTRPADESDLMAESSLNPRVSVVRITGASELEGLLLFDDNVALPVPGVPEGDEVPATTALESAGNSNGAAAHDASFSGATSSKAGA
ncbi:MAG: DUF58 domain-containing protein [Planctomycetota bacterium]